MDKILDRVMAGETPLQAVARLAERPAQTLRSIERFPYYTSFPFGWYRAAFAEDVAVGDLKPLQYLNRDLIVWRGLW